MSTFNKKNDEEIKVEEQFDLIEQAAEKASKAVHQVPLTTNSSSGTLTEGCQSVTDDYQELKSSLRVIIKAANAIRTLSLDKAVATSETDVASARDPGDDSKSLPSEVGER